LLVSRKMLAKQKAQIAILLTKTVFFAIIVFARINKAARRL